jgi:hypothetical protein
MHTTWDAAWDAALTDLELDVHRAEALLRAVHAGAELPSSQDVLRDRWDPPRGLGPLPWPLVERARAVLARQQQVAQQLVEATHVNRRHARAANALRDRSVSTPVYLDVAL